MMELHGWKKSGTVKLIKWEKYRYKWREDIGISQELLK